MTDRPAGPATAPAYPPHWEADVVASDGGTVHLRPIVPADADALVAMHARTSERTRYLRFFGPYPRIPAKDLARFTQVDYRYRVAFVLWLGGELIAVGRYEGMAGSEEAEVAFLVEDAQQKRGLGSVLLEHLAAAARENGIRRFTAEVLAENPRMVRIFLDAGYRADRSYEEGVVHLEFPIEPTESSVQVVYAREQRAEARSLERLLKSRSVAVIGASNDPGKIGHVVLRNLLAFGLAGPIYPVHPTSDHVSGVPAYASVLDIPHDVDLAVLTVPAEAVQTVVEECGRKRVRGLVVISGGFGERDEEGRTAQQRLVENARAYGMRVIGPNCLGVVNTAADVSLNATISPHVPPPGRVGFFCQSGALGVAILADAKARGLGMSTFVSAGNRVDVSGNDLLQYWSTDDRTEVILLHLESFGNPRKFARLTRSIGRTKPIIAVKSGRFSHAKPDLARSVAMEDEVVQTLFESSGVMRVETLAQGFDLAFLLAHQPLPAGRRVAVVGNSSALGVLVADACLERGLVPAEGFQVDIGPEGSVSAFETELERALASPDVDCVVAVFVPPVVTDWMPYAAALGRVAAAGGKPVVTTFLGLTGVPDGLSVLGPHGEALPGSVPSYPTPERAVLALARAEGYRAWRDRPTGIVANFPDLDRERAVGMVRAALAGHPADRELDATRCQELLGVYGIRLADEAPPDGGISVAVGVVEDPSFGGLMSFGLSGLAAELFGDVAYRALPLTDLDVADLVSAPRAFPLLTGYRGAASVDLDALHDLVARVAALAADLPEIVALHLDPVLASADGVVVTRARVRLGADRARFTPGPRRLPPSF